jgi:hypothetical protein
VGAVNEPRAITLTRRGMLAVGLTTFLMIALLGGQLTFIVMQRNIVDHQREIAARQEKRSALVLETTRSLLGSPDGAQRAVARAGTALDQLQEVLDTVQETEVAEVAARALERAPDLLRDVDQAVALLDRTYPTLRSSLRIQSDTLSILRRSLEVQERTLAVADSTRDIAADTRDAAAETRGLTSEIRGLTVEIRDIARATLARVESIDRKTGGSAPPVLP